MTEERRRRLADLARQQNLLVIEDDSCSEFSYDGDPPPPVKSFDSGGHVVFIKGFSKTVVPGLRVGGVVAHGALMASLIESKSIADRFTSPMIQRTLWRYLTARQYQRDLEVARATYRRRRDVVLKTLEQAMPEGITWTKPAAGFNLWLTLPRSISASEAFEAALSEGVACGFGDLFLAHVPPPNGLRISFADKPEPILEEGVRRLAKSLGKLIDAESERSQDGEFVTAV
jgi:DNA-binding transcriptional MocR family regulator